MEWQATSDHLVKISALLCMESCVMTGLNMAGYEYRYFLLESWGLLYEANTILCGKNLTKIDLEYVYGIKMNEVVTDLDGLKSLLTSDTLAIVSTYASKLSFFPKYQISFDEFGFRHQSVLYGYDSDTDLFAIADPIADYVGTISAKELLEASVEGHNVHLWCMQLPSHSKIIAAMDVYRRATHINFSQYKRSLRALESMRGAIQKLRFLENADQIAWIERNNLAINAIIKVRQKVWEYFSLLKILTEKQVATVRLHAQGIIKHWMAVNFLLTKYQRKLSDSDLILAIDQRLAAIQEAELDFLQVMLQMNGSFPEVNKKH